LPDTACYSFFQGFSPAYMDIRNIQSNRAAIFFDAIPYVTFPAVLRLSLIAVPAAGTWFLMITVLITNLAIHSTGSKQNCINLFRHFHNRSLISKSGIVTLILSWPLPSVNV